MKHSTWFRATCLLLAAAGALLLPRPALANAIVPVTLGFESEGLDLDTGMIVPIELWTLAVDPADPQPDLVLACNPERKVRAVVFHNWINGVQIATRLRQSLRSPSILTRSGPRTITWSMSKPPRSPATTAARRRSLLPR